MVKNPPANARDERDSGSIRGSGGSPGVGNGKPLQYSCLENSNDRGVWWAEVHGVTKESDTTQYSTDPYKSSQRALPMITGIHLCKTEDTL